MPTHWPYGLRYAFAPYFHAINIRIVGSVINLPYFSYFNIGHLLFCHIVTNAVIFRHIVTRYHTRHAGRRYVIVITTNTV